jgi:1-acyl-sn-glycerol-3-phosphate acyltransferase
VLYGISRALSRALGVLYFRYEVRGRENVPREGGVILAANHQSFLDVLLIGAACPRPVRYLARRTLWDHRLLGWLITDWKAIPVDRDRPGKDELRGIVETIRGGEVLALFPEGTRTLDGSIGEMRGGIGFLARRAGVPVVPVRIDGAFRAWPRGRRFPRPGKVRIDIGEPVTYDETMEDRDVAADVRRRILALRDGPDEPRPGPDRGGAACASQGGKGAA